MASDDKTTEPKKPSTSADILRKMIATGKSIPSRPSAH